MVMVEPSQFITDYRGFSIVVAVLFSVLGPPSLLLGIMAVCCAFAVSLDTGQPGSSGNSTIIIRVLSFFLQSRKLLKEGKLKAAKQFSVGSAYLSVGTIIFGLISMMLIVLLPTGYRFQINGGT